MKTISLLGCGFLGLRYAQKALEEGFCVIGSTKTEHRHSLLKEMGCVPLILDIYQVEKFLKTNSLSHPFWDSEILVITVPFHRHLDNPWIYPQAFQTLFDAVKISSVKAIIFTSSTSVYKDTDQIVNENSAIGSQPRSRALHKTEQFFSKNLKIPATILRLGGLLGFERHPGNFLKKDGLYSHPEKPVNLVHVSDIVSIIHKIITGDFWGYTFNVVSNCHMSRKDFYTSSAKALGLCVPSFEKTGQRGKIVDNSFLKKTLSFEFAWNGESFSEDSKF